MTNEEFLKTGYKHREAFYWQLYSEVSPNSGVLIPGGEQIMTWNSRDGVTPMSFFENGREYMHVKRMYDTYEPDYRPKPGDRIWRNISPVEAYQRAELRLMRFVGTEYELQKGSDAWAETVEALQEDFLKEPWLETVMDEQMKEGRILEIQIQLASLNFELQRLGHG